MIFLAIINGIFLCFYYFLMRKSDDEWKKFDLLGTSPLLKFGSIALLPLCFFQVYLLFNIFK